MTETNFQMMSKSGAEEINLDIGEVIGALKKGLPERTEIDLRYIIKAVKIFEYSSQLVNSENDNTVLSFARIMRYDYYQKERVVFHKDDINDRIYFILSGSAVIFTEQTPEAFAPVGENPESDAIKKRPKTAVPRAPQQRVEGNNDEAESADDDESRLFKPRMSRRKVRDLTSIIDTRAPFRLRISSILPVTYDEMHQYFNGETQELLSSEKVNQDFKKKMAHYKLLESADREKPGRYVSQNKLLFKVKGFLNKGQHFGETKLNADNIKDVTVLAAEDLQLMSFSLREYQKLFHKKLAKSDNVEFLKPYFPNISYNKLLKVVNLLEECQYNRRHMVYEEDAEVDGLYFIKEGEVQIQKKLHIEKLLTKDEELLNPATFKRDHILASLGPGEVFGEEELLCLKELREYTVIVSSVKATLFKLNSSVYKRLNKDYRDLFNLMRKGIKSKKKFRVEQIDNKLSQVVQSIQKHGLTEKAKVRQEFYSNFVKEGSLFSKKEGSNNSELSVNKLKIPIEPRDPRSNLKLPIEPNSEYFQMSETPKALSKGRNQPLKILTKGFSPSMKKSNDHETSTLMPLIPLETEIEQKSIIYTFESQGEYCPEFELEGQLSPYRRALIPLKRTLEINSLGRDYQSPSPKFEKLRFDFTPSRRINKVPRLRGRNMSPKTDAFSVSFEKSEAIQACQKHRPGTASSQQALSKYKLSKITGFSPISPDYGGNGRIHGGKSRLGPSSRDRFTKRVETSIEKASNSLSIDSSSFGVKSTVDKILSPHETKFGSKREGFLPSKLLTFKKKEETLTQDKSHIISQKNLRNISLLCEEQRSKIRKVLK